MRYQIIPTERPIHSISYTHTPGAAKTTPGHMANYSSVGSSVFFLARPRLGFSSSFSSLAPAFLEAAFFLGLPSLAWDSTSSLAFLMAISFFRLSAGITAFTCSAGILYCSASLATSASYSSSEISMFSAWATAVRASSVCTCFRAAGLEEARIISGVMPIMDMYWSMGMPWLCRRMA